MIYVKVVQIGQEVLDAFPSLTSETARFLIARDLMEGARAKLIKLASDRLFSTRADYIAGIQPIAREGKAVVLALVGVLPDMIEHGWDGRFLHETLLGDNAKGWKVSKEGDRYRSIPFRHKTPNAGPQGGQPMGSQYASQQMSPRNWQSLAAAHAVVDDIAALGKKIHAKAKALTPGKVLPAGLAPKLRPHHATDIFAGMKVNLQNVRAPGGGVAKQRTYTTFRTISEANPESWYHPGIQARNLLLEVEKHVEKIAPGAIKAYIDQALKGGK